MSDNNELTTDLWNLGSKAAYTFFPIAGIAMDAIRLMYKHFYNSDNDWEIPQERFRNYQEPVLSKQRLADISKVNKVFYATEVYARKNRLQDAYSITLTYGYNGEPIPPKKNNYVVIISKDLNNDVIELFGDNELIIIK